MEYRLAPRFFPPPRRALFAAAFTVALAWLAAPAAAADWPCFLGDAARTGGAADPFPAHPRVAWRAALAGPAVTSPAVAGGLVIAGCDGGTLHALDTATGAERWVFRANGPVRSSACVSGGRVFFGARDGFVYALSLADGRFEWAFDAGGAVASSPCVAGGLLLVSTGGRELLALDTATGEPRWRAPLESPSHSSPAVRDGRVFVAANDGLLRAFSLETGALLHQAPTPGAPGYATPCLPDGALLLLAPGGLSRDLLAFSPASGAELWRAAAEPGVSPAPAVPATRLNPVYRRRLKNLEAGLAAGGADRAPARAPNYYVSAVDAALNYFSAGVAADAERVYLVSGLSSAFLYAIDRATRAVAWRADLGEFSQTLGFHPTPLLVAGTLIAPDGNGRLRRFDPATGAEAAPVALGDFYYGAPAAADGRLYFVLADGIVAALEGGADPAGPDSDPPVITVVSPAGGATALTARPLIAARVRDAVSGVNVATLRLELDGATVPAGYAAETGDLVHTPAAPLAPGPHTVRVSAADARGNAGESVWSFTVSAEPDVIPPTLAAVSPAPGATVADPLPSIVARVTDAGGAGLADAGLCMILDEAPVPARFDPASGSLTYHPPLPLSEGLHHVTVRAADRAGNRAADLDWTFTTDAVPDGAAPVITALETGAGARVTATRRPRIAARVTDDAAGVDPGRLTLRVDGEAVDAEWEAATGTVAGRPSRFLASGPHTVTVTAGDRAGKVARAAWEFTVDYRLKLERIRVAGVSESGAVVYVGASEPAAGELSLSPSPDLSGAALLSAAGTPSRMQKIHLTGLSPDTVYYLGVRVHAEGDTVAAPRVHRFRTAAAPTAPGAAVSGSVLAAGAPLPGAAVFLTLERGDAFSLPLSATADAGGGFTFDLGALRDRAGAPLTPAAGDLLRISAFGGSSGAGYLRIALADPSGAALPPVELAGTIRYAITLRAGMNAFSPPFTPQGVSGAFDLLREHPDIRQVSAFDPGLQSYRTAARLLGEPAGENLAVVEGAGLFALADAPCELSFTGAPDPPGDDRSLPAGLTLARLPGGRELPDNPVSPYGAKAYLAANPGVGELTGFDPALQRFVSVAFLDGAVRGTDFPLRHDRAYFFGAAAPATLAEPTLADDTPAAAPPPPAAAPIAAAPARAPASAERALGFGLPPRVLAVRLVTPSGAPAAAIPVTLTARSGGRRSLPLEAYADDEGILIVNLADFRAASAGPTSLEDLLFECAAPGAPPETRAPRAGFPLTLEDLVVPERGR